MSPKRKALALIFVVVFAVALGSGLALSALGIEQTHLRSLIIGGISGAIAVWLVGRLGLMRKHKDK